MPKKTTGSSEAKVDAIQALRFYREAPPEALLPPVIAGVILHKTEPALAKDRCLGLGPKTVRVGRFVYYRKSDLQAFCESLPALSCTP
jgi:hypothetical protein